MDFGSAELRIGIVGSRRRTDREGIETYIAQLAPETVVITGGARGPDRWAEEAARARGLTVTVHKPDLQGTRSRWHAADRYHARNQRIVDDSDRIVAFVAPDRTGGTEDTIRRAERAGKPIEVR
jgi:predicted Rossmann fold nucleotide-binding protein DprA/Smf involved in DNA uptake